MNFKLKRNILAKKRARKRRRLRHSGSRIQRYQKRLKDVLSIYDSPDNKKFSYYNVSSSLGALPDCVKRIADTQSEFLAMDFQDNTGREHWGTYLGPFTVGTRTDNGEEVLRPDISYIRQRDIRYWERRAIETQNPRMRMRYAGLVLDFIKKITGKEADYRTIKIPYAKAVIEVVEGEYFEHSVEGYYYGERALEITNKFGLDDLFKKAQDALWAYDHKFMDDSSSGLWGRHFELMIKYLKQYGKYESQLVEENEKRFDRLEQQAFEKGKTTDQYAHILKVLTELLCDYYTKKGNGEKIKEHLDRLAVATRLSFDFRGGMWAQAMLQQLQVLYRKYHLYREANRLYVEIQDWGKKALSCMEPQEFSVPIDNNQLKQYLDDFMNGTPQEVRIKFLLWNLPRLEVERQRQKEEAEQSPLLDLIRTTNYDSSGSPMNNVGVGKDADNQKLMNGMYRRMLVSSLFIRMEIQKMIEENILDTKSAMQMFEGSLLFPDGHKSIVEKGIEAYFQKDYVVACHLLIPQFEAAIRRMVSLCGGGILRANKDAVNGNEYISLDGLLDSSELKDGLGEDIVTYFKNVFTDQYGWNLRNRTSHGLLDTNDFNSTMADRLLHAFLMLSQVTFKEKED